ncbi:hypothetical protein PORY_000123, partial [Pneumocystis oryctolagi]
MNRDPYFPLREELWKKNRDIVKIGIEMEQSLLPVEFGKKALQKKIDETESSLENTLAFIVYWVNSSTSFRSTSVSFPTSPSN